MKQSIRYFAIGLATASLAIFIVYTFFDNNQKQASNESIDEKIEDVKEKGYRVLSEEDYIELAVNSEEENPKDKEDNKDSNKKDDEKNDEKDKKDEDKDDEDEDESYTLHIKENMLGPEVSQLLEENGIIDDADKFTKMLDDDGYSEYIQLGKHKLTSDMSAKEVAKTITNK